MEEWTRILDGGNELDLIYTDFAKAFDSVPHVRLLIKLKKLGINGALLRWIKSFLSNRKQMVVIEGENSDWANVKSGIPQGSVLGPLLFVAYINDMPKCITSLCNIFADDAKVYRKIQNINDTTSLQHDLNNMFDWSQKWQLPFNETKCKCLHLGRANQRNNYTMNDHTLESVTEEKDLGVIIDSSLKFHKHTAIARKKANSILGIIKKTFINLDSTTLPLLYKSMVRPHLEYGNVIWGPHFKVDQQDIEKVQKRATKLISNLKDLPYKQRLEILKLPSLMYRRRRGDMLQTYKIITKKVNINSNRFFTLNKMPTRGHRYKLSTPRSNGLIRSQSFSHRIINDWNSLHDDVVKVETVIDFKKKIDEHWKYDQYQTPFDNI